MSLRIPIETSARHVHISKEDFEKLFGEGASLTYVKELSQPGQYVCKERVTVSTPHGSFENMAILGPFRKETQIEICNRFQKIKTPGTNPAVRRLRRNAWLHFDRSKRLHRT